MYFLQMPSLVNVMNGGVPDSDGGISAKIRWSVDQSTTMIDSTCEDVLVALEATDSRSIFTEGVS